MAQHFPARWPAAVAVGGLAVLSSATIAAAQEVTLSSLDGQLTIQGDLLAFDGTSYRLQTVFGPLDVDAALVSCAGDPCPVIDSAPVAYQIAGSAGLIDDVFGRLVAAFEAEEGMAVDVAQADNGATVLTVPAVGDRGDLTVTLVGNGSTGAIADLIAGNAALAVASRAALPTEISAFAAAGNGDLTGAAEQKIFALDALVAVTSLSNPVRAISERDLARIFAGEITNWSDVGGVNARINIYGRAPDSGTATVFNDLIMAPAQLAVAPNLLITETDAALAAAVAADPLGIAVTSLAQAGDAKKLAVRGVCGIQVEASPFTIKTEEYPLSRRIYAYTNPAETPVQLARLMQFIETPAGQQVVSDAGYVDLGISFQSNNEQGLRYLASILTDDVEVTLPELRAMTQSLSAADRSSITFRFALGSAQLDDRAQDDIVRLANLLSVSDITNQELLLIGYTDSIGDGAANLSLSQRRAEQVREALLAASPALAAGNIPVKALGYGEISPLSCNETDNGRRINRRVEVWLRDIVTDAQ